jgi:hypothetical protein
MSRRRWPDTPAAPDRKSAELRHPRNADCFTTASFATLAATLEETSHEHLVRGARLLDGGAYFEAHEAWEDRCRLETDETWRR